MAYVAPSPGELKTLFPAFAAVADGTVQAWLDRAARVVDESWAEDDYEHATMLLAAHYMVEQGLGTGAEAELAANGAAGFKSFRSGALSLERSAEAASHAYAGSSYGRQFYPLLRANKGGARVAASGALPTGGYPRYTHGSG